MKDPGRGIIREDVLEEKVLSCIVESKLNLNQVSQVLVEIKALAPFLNTVISLGLSARYDQDGADPLKAILHNERYAAWRAKINLGFGRRT